MNLVLKTDVAATNRKLKEYAQANGIKTDATADATGESAAKLSKRKDDSSADPSGLIKGLKKIVVPKAPPPYDPFMGMPRKRDYYELRDSYETPFEREKSNPAVTAGGYDFQQYMDESFLRAFSGLGVFIEDEMAIKSNVVVPAPGIKSIKATDQVFG